MHSVAFQLGPLTIYWYGILTAIGFLLAFWTAGRRAALEQIAADTITGMAPWLIGGAILGARLLYVATHWETEFANQPFVEIFKVRSGLVFYGGLIGASLGTLLYARLKKVPLWKLADVLAPSIPLGHAFGRIGCLMTGCCFGRPCSWPWAIHFPKEHETGGRPVHPTQLYESILNLALYATLAWLFRSKRFDGQVFGIYLVAYAVLRTFVEKFRGDYPAYYLGFITPGQMVSAAIFALGLGLLWNLRPQDKSKERRSSD